MSEKKIGTSFRMDPEVLRKLNAEAQRSEKSLNSILNLICKQHVEWHSSAIDAGMVTIFRPMLKHLLNAFDEDSVKNLAKKIAKEEGQNFITLLSKEYNVDSALKLIETWLKVIKYPYSYDQNGSEHRFHINHDMGKNYSIYLSSLYENVLKEFNVNSEFKISDCSITFVIDTEKPSSSSQSEQDPHNITKTPNENLNKLVETCMCACACVPMMAAFVLANNGIF